MSARCWAAATTPQLMRACAAGRVGGLKGHRWLLMAIDTKVGHATPPHHCLTIWRALLHSLAGSKLALTTELKSSIKSFTFSQRYPRYQKGTLDIKRAGGGRR